MTEREIKEHEDFGAYLRAKLAAGEITPDEAEDEWYYHFNGWPTVQSIY